MFRYVELVLTIGISWLVLVGPAWLVAGVKGIQGLSIATAICFVPGLLFCTAVLFLRQAVTSSPLISMVWSGFRLFFVLTGVLLVRMVRPDYGWAEFLVWLILLYFVTLAIDTYSVIKAIHADQRENERKNETA